MTYGVIGLGRFGFYVAEGLIKQNKSVLIADKNESQIKELANITNAAYVLDSTDSLALKEAGFHNCDFVIVSIGVGIETSILTLMSLKEIGVKNIIIKAITPIHGQILQKLGATRVIYPEKEASIHLLRSFISHPLYEIFDINDSVSVANIRVDENFSGKNANEILKAILDKKEIKLAKVIAIKNGESWDFNPNASEVLYKNGEMIICAPNSVLKNLLL